MLFNSNGLRPPTRVSIFQSFVCEKGNISEQNVRPLHIPVFFVFSKTLLFIDLSNSVMSSLSKTLGFNPLVVGAKPFKYSSFFGVRA